MKPFVTSIALVASLLVSGITMADDTANTSPVSQNTANILTLEDGQAAFNQGNYELAFSLWSRLATQGRSDAQVFVGLSYANGWGVDKSPKIASLWYKKAALKENASAQFLLGLYLIESKDADLPTGVMWLRRAAENGDNSAKRFMKKAKVRGWFNNVPVKEYKSQARAGKIESVAMVTPQ